MRFIKSVTVLTIVLAVTLLGGHSAHAEDLNQTKVSLAVAEIKNDETPVSEAVEITVQAGDTLSSVASANGTSIDEILKINNLSDPNSIEPGQVLKVVKGEQRLTDYYGSLKTAAQAFIEPPAPVVAAPVVAAPAVASTRAATSVPTYSGGSSRYVGNGMWCTDYVHSRRPDVPIYGNAGYNWISAAQARGRATGTTPQAGAIAVMSGHVAYVESVNGDGSYVVSEMGWNYKAGNYNIRTVRPGAFGGFIY